MEITVKEAIQAIKDNSLTSGYYVLREVLDKAIKELDENEKLKEELEKETDLVNSQADEIERLEKLHKKYLDMWGKKETNEMSVAEVLEWLMNAKKHDILYDVLRTDNLNFMFNKLTPQEIIERITEYEKNKVDISKTENNTEHVSNSDEFKVGDKVLYKGQKFTIEDMESNDEIGLESEDGICLSDWVKASELKHAETPKEEPHTCKNCGNNKEYPPPHTCDICTSLNEESYCMWTPKEESSNKFVCEWECYDIQDNDFTIRCNSEDEAISKCENCYLMNREMSYRKVYRMKG